VYQLVKEQHPERWSGNACNWSLPDIVTLNPNKKNKQECTAASNDAELLISIESTAS
jgi:hypothetical protein